MGLYDAPQASVSRSLLQNAEELATPDMVEGIGKAKGWAMFLAVLYYIGFGFICFGGVITFFMAMTKSFMLSLVLLIVFSALGFFIFKLANYIHKYNTAATNILDDEDIASAELATGSFKSMAKMLAWFQIITFIFVIFGIFAATSIPAYKNFILRTQQHQTHRGQ